MKIIGTLIIILCIIGNGIVGFFVWNVDKPLSSMVTNTIEIPADTVSSSNKKRKTSAGLVYKIPSDWEKKMYSQLGLSFSVPIDFVAGDPDSQNGMIASFFPAKNTDSFKPVYMLFATDNADDPWVGTTKEFGVVAREVVGKEKGAVYQDSAFWKDVSGTNVYSFTFTQKNENGSLLKFKRVVIFHNTKQLEIFVVDNPGTFAESEKVFDTIISSLKLF